MKSLQVDGSKLKAGQMIIQEILQFQPFSSISFFIKENNLQALQETRLLLDWGMAKNKSKMKAASLEIIDLILSTSPGNPVNLNLDEYELKSLAEAGSLLQRAFEQKIEGLELTNIQID